jgi:hypothetical protein
LAGQAEALLYLTRHDPAAAERLRAFVMRSLVQPRGGYYAGVSRDGRRDPRVFCDENGRMAAAVLGDPGSSPPEKKAARRALDACWGGRSGGLIPRSPQGGTTGLLGDQLGVIEGLLADKRLAEAKQLAASVESILSDARGEAFYDRPARAELVPQLDRLRFVALNVRAWRLWKAMGLPRAAGLESWLKRRSAYLDAPDLADFVEGLEQHP